jgi:hypothetical protein
MATAIKSTETNVNIEAEPAPALPEAIRINTFYSGFLGDQRYSLNTGDLVTDPDLITYFTNRPDALYDVV